MAETSKPLSPMVLNQITFSRMWLQRLLCAIVSWIDENDGEEHLYGRDKSDGEVPVGNGSTDIR
jgi:hypothetical protein